MTGPSTPTERTSGPEPSVEINASGDVRPRRFHRTDAGQAEFFADLYASNLRYDHRRGRWLVWDVMRWAPDVDETVPRLAIEAARRRHEAATDATGDVRSDEAKFSHSMESRGKLLAVPDLAKSIKPIADDGSNWDANPAILGVANGVVDLRTGGLREGHPDDRITMSTAVRYVPCAPSPRWVPFIDEVFEGDTDLIEFMHRAVGYSLTGDCREEVFFLLHGLGSNGKTVLLRTLASVMGDYATTVQFTALEASRFGGRPSNDIAALVGKRFVMSSETGVSTRFDEARLKSLTGRDPIAARFLYREAFVFQPQLKLWLAVNHLPAVSDHTPSLWRRVVVIPFNATYDGDRAEKDLYETLRLEAEGILAWVVEGARRWHESGWQLPASVVAATARYRLDNDTLAQFLAEECVIAPEAYLMAGAAFQRYIAWAAREGLWTASRLNQTTFGLEMKGRFQSRKKAAGTVYFGVGLLPTGAREDPDD